MSKFTYLTDEELEKIIKITKEFKKKHPYTGTEKEKYQKWDKYLQELSKALHIHAPPFYVSPKIELSDL